VQCGDFPVGAECVQHMPSFCLLLHHHFCCGRVKPFRMVHAVVYEFSHARGVQRLDHGLIALEWPPLWPDDARVRVRFIYSDAWAPLVHVLHHVLACTACYMHTCRSKRLPFRRSEEDGVKISQHDASSVLGLWRQAFGGPLIATRSSGKAVSRQPALSDHDVCREPGVLWPMCVFQGTVYYPVFLPLLSSSDEAFILLRESPTLLCCDHLPQFVLKFYKGETLKQEDCLLDFGNR
jgi:hypothetical protein